MNRHFPALLGSILFFVADFSVGQDSELTNIIPDGARLQTLWEEGGFTEGVAAGPDGQRPDV